MTTESYVLRPQYKIINTGNAYEVSAFGFWLRDKNGAIRRFKTRNSARKRISRELRNDFHR